MSNKTNLRSKLLNILFWSIISAAFIGPGTVTTASKAGASFGTALIWALLFSTIATIVLQEAAARLTIASGKNLGEIVATKFSNNFWLKMGLFLSIFVGCAAYQAGNMLGAIAGLQLLGDWSATLVAVFTLGIGIIAATLLLIGNYKIIANVLGLVVALMGAVFLYVAFTTDISVGEMAKGAFIPSFPDGSLLLILGLVGTTIVPYNLFLASGISKGQGIREMRQGLALAVLIGGIISIAILIAGTNVAGEFSFENLATALAQKTGNWAVVFFGIGLFAAGLSSSITSPLAAAVTAQSLFDKNGNWSVKSLNFRRIWFFVLAFGLAFGIFGAKPIPVIIVAQAVNGLLLPIVVIFLLLAVNDTKLLGEKHVNSVGLNVLSLLIVGVVCYLGLRNLTNVFITNFVAENSANLAFWKSAQIGFVSSSTLVILIWLSIRIFRK